MVFEDEALLCGKSGCDDRRSFDGRACLEISEIFSHPRFCLSRIEITNDCECGVRGSVVDAKEILNVLDRRLFQISHVADDGP